MTSHSPHTHVYTLIIPVRWGDMDAMGHVNNTVYFRYMEQARLQWLESLGYLATKSAQEAPVIVSASCIFRIPFAYPADIEVKVYAGRAGRSSLPTYYEMRRAGDDALYADGEAKIVWTSGATGRSIPLPDRLRALAEHHEESQQ